MLAELRADLLTKPNSLSVRFENKVASTNLKLTLQITINDHEQRVSNLESGLNQIQWNTESVEGTRSTSFFAKLLVDLLGKDVLSAPPKLDRAHRALGPKLADQGYRNSCCLCKA